MLSSSPATYSFPHLRVPRLDFGELASSYYSPVSIDPIEVEMQTTAPPRNPRKRKAPTLRDDDWEPVKARIIELHITQNRPLSEVKETLEQEFRSIGFTATIRQYRTRLSRWGLDKKVKTHEMKAIVRKRQRRKLVETHKGDLNFILRGNVVNPGKIDRWMARNEIAEDMLYSPGPAAVTPAALSAYTLSERGSPAPSPAISIRSSLSTVLSPLQSLGQNVDDLLWWETANEFMIRDPPWLRFKTLLYSCPASALSISQTQDGLNFPDGPVRQSSEVGLKNIPENSIITRIIHKQRGRSFNLEEVMPECFQIDVSFDSQVLNTLSAHSSSIQLANIGVFLAANNLLNGSGLVELVRTTLQTGGHHFFKQLFKSNLPTVHSFTCRLLESLSSEQYGYTLLYSLIKCGLDPVILAGPTGGRSLQLAIWHKNTLLALSLIKNGVQKNPRLGSKEPFNKTPVQLAEFRNELKVYNALSGISNHRTKVAPLQPVKQTNNYQTTEGEIALKKAIREEDVKQIHALLIDGLDIDKARTQEILEWTFFEYPMCYNALLPFGQADTYSWTVPGIITAAINREKLEDYLHSKMDKGIDEVEDEEEYEDGRYEILQRSVELALTNNRIREAHTILGVQWVREYLDLGSLLEYAALYFHLEIMVELVSYGAGIEVLRHKGMGDTMSGLLEYALRGPISTGRLSMLLKIKCFSIEFIFRRNLENLTWGSEESFDWRKNMQVLIDHGLSLNSVIWHEEYDECYTPLQMVMEWGSLEMVRYLLDAGARINYTPEECSYTTLGRAVKSCLDPEIVRFLIKEGADVNEFADDQETTLVELAVTHSDPDDSLELVKTLLEGGAAINGPTRRKPTTSWNTALTRAISNPEQNEIIYFALGAGADINQMGGGKGAQTPLQAAAQQGDVDIAKELLIRKACVNAPAAADHGRTALQAACEGGKRSEEMILLLLEAGADVSALPSPKYGRTALQALCSSGNPSLELVKYLIDRGANINEPATDCGGFTALQGAVMVGNNKIAIFLIDRGADVNAPASRQEGRMALDGAAEHGRLDTVHLLLAFGATCMEPGVSGYDSAVEFAEDNGHFPIAEMLRNHRRQPEDNPFDVNVSW